MITHMHKSILGAICLISLNIIALELLMRPEPKPRKTIAVPTVLNTSIIPKEEPDTFEKQEPNTTWRYNRRVCSGLGDRMCLMFMMSALGRAANAIVHVRWCEGEGNRLYDLSSFRSILGTPPHVVLVPDSVFDAQTAGMPDVLFDHTEIAAREGYDCVYTLGPKTFRAPAPFNTSLFTRAYHSAGRDWTLPRSSPPYVVLHIRGTDKLDPNLNDFFTTETVRAVAAAGLHIMVVSDDHPLTESILQNTDHVPTFAPDDNVYHHVALLHGARGIIQHSQDGWSAFSSSVALFRGIPLLNTWKGAFNRIREFEKIGGGTFELRADNINAFVADAVNTSSSAHAGSQTWSARRRSG